LLGEVELSFLKANEVAARDGLGPQIDEMASMILMRSVISDTAVNEAGDWQGIRMS
jgi:hypothetical protein